jgi:sugar/nucleoside kinase (ribokinase family)
MNHKSSARIVTVGGMRIDYLITQEGRSRNGLMGGNALYSAAGAALWSDSVGLWAKIGQNYPAIWIDELEKRGLAAAGLIDVPGEQDHRTFYAYTPDGSRFDTNPEAHYARIGQMPPEALDGYVDSTPGQDDPDDFDPLSIQPSDWPEAYSNVVGVHLAPMPLSSHLHIPKFLREKQVELITLDPGERYMVPDHLEYIKNILSEIDIFLPSKQEVRSLLGMDIDMETAASIFVDWGVRVVVIKGGSDGVFLLSRQASDVRKYAPFHDPGDKRVVDVTGAGDAFCGGLIRGLLRSDDYHTAVLYGLVSSSMVLEGFGARYAFALDRDKAYARLAYLQLRHREIKKARQ